MLWEGTVLVECQGLGSKMIKTPLKKVQTGMVLRVFKGPNTS